MALPETLDFEENDTSDFDSVVTFRTGSTITADAAAKRSGSYGCKCYVPGGETDMRAHGVIDLDSGVGEFYMVYYLDISALVMADGDVFWHLYDANVDALTGCKLEFQRDGANYQIQLAYRPGTSDWVTLNTSGFNKIEIYMKIETGENQDDGICRFTVNDVEILENLAVTDQDGKTFDSWHIGYRYLTDTGTSGSLYIDDILIDDSEPVASTFIPTIIVIS